ncbi:uncharacterized protein LOC123531513 isoform X3 [Mercenaria mercenaria]|uniref:uncharacterized protein LOC123531513 isoform X3 n=1 Tax=Mercenaria mercenaria TaxID=6596 RepID=UPI00234F40BC|nr:uncharacterized protein LOC123531513 isoform X3 [Mercenaria mercenaria]
MNNQGNFPNTGMRPTLNQGQMSGQNMQQQQQQQQMVMMEQMMNSGNANPMLGLFQSNMHGMNQQQRAMFFENFQRNFQMMQQQSNSNMPLQQQGIMGNGNARMLNMMQEAMRMQGNSQAQSMMGQPQGIMGNGNSQVMNMQQSLIGQQGSVMSTQQGLCGHQQTMSGQQQQPQTHQVVGGIQRQMVSQGQPQQASGGRASTMSSVGQSQQSRVKSQGILISGNPAVYTQNTGQGSQSTTTKSELIKNVNELSKIRGILKNTQSVSAAPSSKVSTSEKQSLSSTQWKSDKLKDMLKTYFYPSEDDETSAEDSVQKQTDTLSQGNMQTVHSSTSNSKTSPLQRRTMASCAKQVVNITNSRTGGPSSGVSTANRGQLNPVSKTSTLQTKSSTVTSQSAQRSKVEGQSIPTLVSSGLRKQKDQPMKRKADTEIGTEVKKSKVTAQQTARVPTEVEDEDPEYVQAQVFISKIPNETTKGMILDILQHYNFTSPKVWIGRHNSRKDQICAFVKLPSLKDSKRVIAEMKGFPYKGREMEIRFSAAADFIDYTVPSDGVSQSRVAGVQQPAPIIDTRNPPPGSSQPPAATALHVANTGIPPPTMLHPLPGSAIPVETVPTMIPAPVSVAPVAYPTVAVPVYAGVPPPAQNIYTTPVAYRIESTDKPYLDRGSYQRDYRRSLSPRDRRGYSPQYSSHRDRYPSPYGSSSRDRRLSPDYSSRGRHSSPGYSPHRRYSRSPDYHSLSPDRQAYRRSRSRSPYDSHSRERGYYSPTRGRSLTPDYTSRHRSGYENSPLDDRYSQRSQESSFDYTAGRDRRSSLPSDGRYRDSPYRGRSQERSQEVPNIETHGLSDIYCVHIENLPADIKDSELEGLIEAFLYNSVRLKVRDGKATADIVVSSITEAKIMMQQLDGRRFMGAKLQVDWYREAPVTESEERIDSRPIFTRSPDLRESVRTADSRSGTGYSDRERPGRSVDRDHSVRSLERDHSRRSLERDLSRRSADRERSRRSPDRDKSTRSGDKYPAWDKRDRFKDADKSLFQSYIDSSYPNAPVLGRKYIKEFSSKGSSTAYYLCVLCEMTLTWRNIADHMMGYKHRLKCIKRSHPKIYDKICLIQSKVDMLGQCAKYALELENKQELINRIETPHPESSASQHLKRIKEAETTEKDKRYDKKRAEDRTSGRKKEDEKKDENSPDSTSDIFKKIEAYKKKFEASKDTSGEGDSGEPQAKKPRTDEREKSGMSFKDLTKQNKTLADSIQKGIESARKGAEQKKTTSVRKIDWKKEITAAKKRIEESKKFQAEIDAKAEANRNEQEVSKDIAQEERKDANKVSPVSSKAKNEQVIQKLTKESQGKQGEGKPRSANEMVGESKNVNTKVCEAKSLNVKTINEKVCDSKNRISTIGKVNDSEKTVTVAKTKPDIENKKVSKEEEQGLSENDKGKSKNINKRDDDAEELTIDPEDIEDLGKSISAELFGEELGNMEDEEVVEEKSEPAKGKMSNHPLSKLQKYFDMQLLKDPESSGIVGMQYVIEAIPFKASKAHVYKCTLCSVKCATTSIVDHILGYKHRMKYFEIHNFDIYSIIMKMDQSRKFLNAECTKYAKSIQEKEGVKTVMTLTDEEFKQREKIFNKERDEEKRKEKARLEAEASTSKADEKKEEDTAVKVGESETKDVPEIEEKVEPVKVDESPKIVRTPKVSLAQRVKEAKAAAKLVSHSDGRETVELYKYIQHKPDVPLLGLSNVTEIQGLYGNKSKTAAYLCQLCLPTSKVDGTPNIYEHLIGIKHMENYLTKHFPCKMIHLKLITQHSAKTAYLHNQAKLLCQAQMKQPESIYVVNMTQLEEEKTAMELAKAAAKAVEEAAKAEAEALAAAKKAAMKTAKSVVQAESKSTPEGVIDLTAEEIKYEPVVAHLYTKLTGLEDTPLVGLSYITEIQGICADKVPPRYQCRLCDDDLITANYINAHITGTEHRMRFLKLNYPVFYSRALGDSDQTEKLCREIEQQFGRESISVKKRILVRPDGSVVYSDDAVVKDIWIIGDSIPLLAGARANELKKPDLNAPGQRTIGWWGIRDMSWDDFQNSVKGLLPLTKSPDIIFIHLGGNDMISKTQIQIGKIIKQDILYLHETMPDSKIIWMDILQRLSWDVTSDNRIEYKRRRVNRWGRQHVKLCAHSDVLSIDMNVKRPELFLEDGIHLSELGQELYLDAVQNCISKNISSENV